MPVPSSTLAADVALQADAPAAPALAPRRAMPAWWGRGLAGAQRAWLPVLGVVLLALAPLLLGRQAVVHHRAERQAQAIQMLAQGLTGLPGPLAQRLQLLPRWSAALPAQVRISRADGQVLAQWQQWRLPVLAPAAFVDALALPGVPAHASVPVDGQVLRIELRAGVADLLDLLWQLWLASTAALSGLAAAAMGLAGRSLRRQAAQAAQAGAELLERQQALFSTQARQLEDLRQAAHADGLTGLSNRRHFVAALGELLAQQGATAQLGLVLLRLRDLDGMNRRLGHAGTDRVLQALAQTLQTYPQRIEHCMIGRLNGADFALVLPTGGLALETAQSLVLALRSALRSIDGQASVAAGAVEIGGPELESQWARGLPGGQRPPRATEALAMADAALAEAEMAGDFAVAAGGAAPLAGGTPAGEGTWQRRIGRALARGWVALGEFPVCTPDGRALLLDCPLRVRFEPGGVLEPAQRWLSLAVRSRLCAQVDEKAVALALAAIATDGVARCVNVSAQAAASPEFVAAVTRRLEAMPEAACRLWIDLPEALALERPMLVRELSRRWRPLGAMLALEHAGEGLMRIHGLIDLGLDCVRIDGRFVNGVADPAADDARRYLQGLVRLVQSVGLQVTAESVRDVADLDALWALGFDAATGPAVVAAAAAGRSAPADRTEASDSALFA